MIEIEFPIRRMDWVENPDSLFALTYEDALDDLMSCLDNPNDCIYSYNEMLDILAEHLDTTQHRLNRAATFGLAELKAKERN